MRRWCHSHCGVGHFFERNAAELRQRWGKDPLVCIRLLYRNVDTRRSLLIETAAFDGLEGFPRMPWEEEVEDDDDYLFPTFLANMLTFIVLYSGIIPIAFLMAITVANYVQAMFVNWDKEMYHSKTDTAASCRTMELVQELGHGNAEPDGCHTKSSRRR